MRSSPFKSKGYLVSVVAVMFGCLIGIEAHSKSVACSWERFKDQEGRVAGVQDGDTLTLLDQSGFKHKARLVGIDTPEVYYYGKSQGDWARRASLRLKELLPKGSRVTLVFDRQKCDFNGRLLVHVFFQSSHINQMMIEEGWAINYCVAPNELYCTQFGELVRKNQDSGRGFLRDPSVEIPYLFRVQVRQPNFHYHVGSLYSKRVVPSSDLGQIPIDQRIIFYSSRYIRPPYYLSAEGESMNVNTFQDF